MEDVIQVAGKMGNNKDWDAMKDMMELKDTEFGNLEEGHNGLMSQI